MYNRRMEVEETTRQLQEGNSIVDHHGKVCSVFLKILGIVEIYTKMYTQKTKQLDDAEEAFDKLVGELDVLREDTKVLKEGVEHKKQELQEIMTELIANHKTVKTPSFTLEKPSPFFIREKRAYRRCEKKQSYESSILKPPN